MSYFLELILGVVRTWLYSTIFISSSFGKLSTPSAVAQAFWHPSADPAVEFGDSGVAFTVRLPTIRPASAFPRFRFVYELIGFACRFIGYFMALLAMYVS